MGSMFTGIIRHVGAVLRIDKTTGGKRLTIDVGPLAKGSGAGAGPGAGSGTAKGAGSGASSGAAAGSPLTSVGLGLGDSVAVSGVCLTASAIAGAAATFDVIAETLDRTRLGSLGVGARVNLERSLQAGGSLDGHLVQGHVDGLATVANIRRGGQFVLEFAAAPELLDQMVPKGSVAIDGVSLTLVDVTDSRFCVAIIPTTLAETTLGGLEPGDKVNIETDVIGKYVQKYLRQLAVPRGRVNMRKLQDEGFI